jgi:CRISPR system Cascade subunit CasC
LYFSKGERAAMAKTVLDNWDALKASDRSKTVETLAREWVKLNKGTTSAPDIALFGRMLAEHPDLNIDAACQVAHAISTHRVSMEMDYYTAVDDLTPDDNAGAGMIGFTGFNSACFYRYACLDWNQLLSNLNGDTALARKTVEAFLKASSDAIPTGKQNGFAANNPPGFYLAVAREDGSAWSLANAFEQPVKPAREGGYMRPSIQALDAYWGMLEKVYDADGVKKKVTLSLDDDAELVNLKDAPAANRGAWITAVLDALPGK